MTVALASDLESVIAELTRYRRGARREHADNAAMPVIFNDCMNTLNGDPTAKRLAPLIDAAAEAGAEYFCIDAGWYGDGYWWDTVGDWRPAERRFPDGLDSVLDRIRRRGMVPGLWLEPEVVGMRSEMATRLPDAAFLSRWGVRVVEHERFHLDLRHEAAVAHLDAVIDRLVRDHGSGTSNSTTTSIPDQEPTVTPTVRAPPCSTTIERISPGSTACSTGIPASSSRTAGPERCDRTSRCSRDCSCVDV